MTGPCNPVNDCLENIDFFLGLKTIRDLIKGGVE